MIKAKDNTGRRRRKIRGNKEEIDNTGRRRREIRGNKEEIESSKRGKYASCIGHLEQGTMDSLVCTFQCGVYSV